MIGSETPQLSTFVWRLVATLFFVLLNGFFVAAEFALVKVRATQVEALVDSGNARARVTAHILEHLDRYLSACQLGITIASLVLGWLAEPAVAELLLVGAGAAGLEISAEGALLHGVALGLALAVVTLLHMTVGEQTPKIWAIHRAQATALRVAVPLKIFASLFRPFIWVVNALSNALLRAGGLSASELTESASHNADEIRVILASAAQSGHISSRQMELAQNVIDMMDLEVRHIMVPRVDVSYLTLQNSLEENLSITQTSGHSRFPLCRVGLDTVIGIVHTKNLMAAQLSGASPDLERLARRPLFVSDTQPLSRLILQLQRSRNHCCVVLDEHGTTVGLAFLEDALEEIVGPLGDEFDEELPQDVVRHDSGAIEMVGSLPLPEAQDVLGLGELAEEADTIGGLVVATLGRLPRKGDSVDLGGYRAHVAVVKRRRIERLWFEPLAAEAEREAAP